ncbi:hypothetical protein Tco_0857311 [Tanacetum coccineum]|uniref:Uncharacterized protein n=1 Tax=Tanacetum coccineum TaxID=301880 RepID=A0ABQ5BBK8_9ASTR
MVTMVEMATMVGIPNIAAMIAQQLQALLPTIVTKISNNAINQGNGNGRGYDNGNGGNNEGGYEHGNLRNGMVRATKPSTIQSVILKAIGLTDDAVMDKLLKNVIIEQLAKDGEKNVFWSINEEVQERTMFKFSSNQFAYPEKKLTINEMLAKLINEGMQEYEEIGIFIREFKTTNELLLKEQNNLLTELKIKVHQFSKVMSEVLFSRHKVIGVTTKGGKMTYEVTYDKEINKANNDHNEPSRFQHNEQEKPQEAVVENESPKVQVRTIQPFNGVMLAVSSANIYDVDILGIFNSVYGVLIFRIVRSYSRTYACDDR